MRKMNRSTFAICIGVLSCIGYSVLAGLTISDLVQLGHHEKEVANYGTVMTLLCVSLMFFVIMCLISGIMIRGVQKRRQELISPWIILGAVGIGCSILNFFISGIQQPAPELISSLTYIALSGLVWYPIFTLWRDMRNGSFATSRAQEQQEQQQYQPPPGYYAPPPVYPTEVANESADYAAVPPQKA